MDWCKPSNAKIVESIYTYLHLASMVWLHSCQKQSALAMWTNKSWEIHPTSTATLVHLGRTIHHSEINFGPFLLYIELIRSVFGMDCYINVSLKGVRHAGKHSFTDFDLLPNSALFYLSSLFSFLVQFLRFSTVLHCDWNMDAALHHTSGIFTWAAKWPTGPRNCHASHGRLIHGNLPNI